MTREEFEAGKHFRARNPGAGGPIFFKEGPSVWTYWEDLDTRKKIEASLVEFTDEGFEAKTHFFLKPITMFFPFADFELINQNNNGEAPKRT